MKFWISFENYNVLYIQLSKTMNNYNNLTAVIINYYLQFSHSHFIDEANEDRKLPIYVIWFNTEMIYDSLQKYLKYIRGKLSQKAKIKTWKDHKTEPEIRPTQNHRFGFKPSRIKKTKTK